MVLRKRTIAKLYALKHHLEDLGIPITWENRTTIVKVAMFFFPCYHSTAYRYADILLYNFEEEKVG